MLRPTYPVPATAMFRFIVSIIVFLSDSHEKTAAIPLISAEVYFGYRFSIFCSFRV